MCMLMHVCVCVCAKEEKWKTSFVKAMEWDRGDAKNRIILHFYIFNVEVVGDGSSSSGSNEASGWVDGRGDAFAIGSCDCFCPTFSFQ